MIKVTGLTGGIGTGKSTAAEYFVKKGFAHIDADEISRDLTADGSSLLPVLDELFGPEGRWGDGNTEILDGDGSSKQVWIRDAMLYWCWWQTKKSGYHGCARVMG